MMKAMTSGLAVLLGALTLGCALGACAGASKSPASAAPSAMEPGGDRAVDVSGDPRAEIDRLWGQIEMWEGRDSAGADSMESMPTTAGAEPAGAGHTQGVQRGTARGAERAAELCPDVDEQMTPLCSDVCVLAGSICDNADNICRIAGELAGDAWAEGKCDSARTSCEQATERCCSCRGGDRPE